MDKLKPLLENRFWILLFFAMLFPTIGWFVASGTFAKELEERENALKQAFDSVSFSGNVPNDSWTKNAQVLVEQEQTRLDRTSVYLWETQKQSMDWPAGVQELIVDVPFEGPIPPRARENYRRIGQGYEKQLSDIEAILQPYDPETRTGLILVNRDVYTHVPIGTWRSAPPTSREMWNAQMDAWLVRGIFKSIASMNRGSDRLSNSTIVQILQLKLRGGVRDFGSSQSTAAAGGGGAVPTGDAGEPSEMYDGGEGYGMAGGGMGGAKQIGGKLQFDLSDELGPDGGGRGAMGGGYSAAPMLGGDVDADGMPGGGGGAGAARGPRRYVDDDDNLPFRTRGFVLGVVMHHGYLNEFLAELSGSEWPIQILRVHQQMNNPDNLALARSGSRTRGTGAAPTLGRRGGGFGGTTGGGEYGAMPGGASYEDTEYGGGTGGMTGGGMLGGGGGAGVRGAGSRANDLMVRQALSDPHLATVWIGGLITLFKPVDVEPVSEEDAAEIEAAEAAEAADLADPAADPNNADLPADADSPDVPPATPDEPVEGADEPAADSGAEPPATPADTELPADEGTPPGDSR
jgi:hypothetical protein